MLSCSACFRPGGDFVIAQTRSAAVGEGLASLLDDVVELSSSESAKTEKENDVEQQRAHETPWEQAALILLHLETRNWTTNVY